MALPILDGNQTSTTLATTVSGGAHYPNHIIANGTVTANVAWQSGEFYPFRADGDSAPDFGAGIVFQKNDYGAAIVGDNNPLPISGTLTANNLPVKAFDDAFEGGNVVVAQLINADGEVSPANPLGVYVSNPITIGSCVTHGVTVANSVTIASLPAISGTVTANVPLSADGFTGVQGVRIVGAGVGNVVRIEGVGTSYGPADMREGGGIIALGKTGGNPGSSNDELRAIPLNSDGMSVMISGTVTANVTNSVTIGSLPVQLSTTTIGGTARLNVTLSSATTVGATAPSYANLYGGSDGTNLRAISVDSSGRTVVTGSVSVANTTVTISALPSGALTTRFGSVTTANLAQISTAVTNSSRKYLLIQNITTASNAITIGVGFTPTTTQGIQLVAGAGITFESSYIPTGAVYILSSVTASAFTILEA